MNYSKCTPNGPSTLARSSRVVVIIIIIIIVVVVVIVIVIIIIISLSTNLGCCATEYSRPVLSLRVFSVPSPLQL